MTLKTRALSGMLAILLPTCALQVQAAPPLDAMPTATGHYVFIPASTFVPRNSIASYRYLGGGCVSAPRGTELAHKLILPQGSVLRYVRSFYKDASADALAVYVTHYDAAGALVDVGSVTSANGSGYTSGLSPDMNYTVDATNQAYVVNARTFADADTVFIDGFDGVDAGVVFCGVRVLYEL